MTLWKVHKHYGKNDTVYYDISPYNLIGHLKCCIKWYGWNGLKWAYLFKKQAEKKARKLTEKENSNEACGR